MLTESTWALAVKETKSRFAGHTTEGTLGVYALLPRTAERVITLIDVCNTQMWVTWILRYYEFGMSCYVHTCHCSSTERSWSETLYTLGKRFREAKKQKMRLPVQVLFCSLYPVLHTHLKLPSVFSQRPLMQGLGTKRHSSISVAY